MNGSIDRIELGQRKLVKETERGLIDKMDGRKPWSSRSMPQQNNYQEPGTDGEYAYSHKELDDRVTLVKAEIDILAKD